MEEKLKEKFYKKWWFWVIVVIVIFILIGSNSFSKKNEGEQQQTTENTQVVTKNDSAFVAEKTKVDTTTPIKTETKTVPTTTQIPTTKTIQLPKSDPVSPPSSQVTASKISGLTAIRISGGIWGNWNADMANDGPFVEIFYLDNSGNIIGNNETKQLPISADVKVYTADTNSIPWEKGRLVFSAHYSSDQIILGKIYPKIRIPKEQISVNPAVDSQYGYVSVTIHTPEQGDFSDEDDSIELYE